MLAETPLDDLDRLIEPTRIHRSVYVDESIFAAELLRIFARNWIYVGHGSQIPNVGDYYATRIGREPVFMIRGEDGRIRVFLNRCMHKGAQLLGEGNGTARTLRCGYHGWAYGLDGALRHVAAQKGYSAGSVCPGSGEFALQTVAASDDYRGFVFARLRGDGPELSEWLGPLASSIDNFVDRAPTGEVEVAGGVLRYEHACNWKFFTENTLDALHPMVVHSSAARAARVVAAAQAPGTNLKAFVLQALAPFAGSHTFYDDMGARVMPHGHADLGGNASIHSSYDEDEEYLRAMVSAYGEQRAQAILSLSRNNSLAYPSLMFKAPMQLIRVVRPIAVDRTVLETWHFRLKGAPPSLLQRTLAYSTLVNSCAGMVGPDDHQIYRQLQSGLAASKAEWVEMGRYADTGSPDTDGSISVKGTSDALFRGQFSAWHSMMRAR